MPTDERDECKKGRDDAYETLNKDQAEYDKQLLALSAAFLGVSLAFVKDVVPLSDTHYLWTFDAALGCLLGCVCVVLGTFQYSIHGHFRLGDYWELKEELLGAEGDEKTRIETQLVELWNWLLGKQKTIVRLNRGAGIVFAIGTVFLVVFVVTNMHSEAHSIRPSNGHELAPTVIHDSHSEIIIQGSHSAAKATDHP